ncbi:putative alpha/beta hydrolase-1 [Helianthus annuus]|nr:putative alpha/beta hydrolase-1 [Helianthus annuus]
MATIPPEEKVVLVGHSLGGMNIALAMEKFPEKVSVAIFLTAFMPDSDHNPSYVLDQVISYFNFNLLFFFFEIFNLKSLLFLLVLKYNEITPAEAWLDTQFLPYSAATGSEISMCFGPEFLSSKLYQLCSVEDRELGKTLMRPSSLFVKDLRNAERFTKRGFGSVRRVYVVCDEDNAIKEGFQRWMSDNNPVDEVKELKHVDHMPMLCDPKQLSVCLLDLAVQYA